MLLLFKSTELGSFITSHQEFPNQTVWYTGCDQISSLILQHFSLQPPTSERLKSRPCSLICPGFHTQRDFCTFVLLYLLCLAVTSSSSRINLADTSSGSILYQTQLMGHPRPFGLVYWPCFLPRVALVTTCSIINHNWKEHCHHCHQPRSASA